MPELSPDAARAETDELRVAERSTLASNFDVRRRRPPREEPCMPRYLISFDAHAMDHIPDEDMPAVTDASLAVVQEAVDAGVWVFGGGLEHQRASIVATDGKVTDGPYPEAIGGLCVVDVPTREEAVEWAAKVAVASAALRRSGSSCPTRP